MPVSGWLISGTVPASVPIAGQPVGIAYGFACTHVEAFACATVGRFGVSEDGMRELEVLRGRVALVLRQLDRHRGARVTGVRRDRGASATACSAGWSSPWA